MDDLQEQLLTLFVELKQCTAEHEHQDNTPTTPLCTTPAKSAERAIALIQARDSKRDAYIIGSDVTQQERHHSDHFGDWCGDQVDTCICDEINALKAEQRRRAGS